MFTIQPNSGRNSIFGQPNINSPPPVQGQNVINQYGQTYSGIFQQQSQSNIQSNQQYQNLQPIPQQQQIQQQQQQYQLQQQYQQQYQQQQQLDPNNNQVPQIDQNAQFNNVAQYGQQFQQIYQEPDNFTNPNAIPQKIDLQFYGIYDKLTTLKPIYCQDSKIGKLYNTVIIQKKNTAESHSKIIVKNFLEFTQLEYNVMYVVSTDEDFWILKITDLDGNLYDYAYQVFEDYYKSLTEQQQLVKTQDNIELFKQITSNLESLTSQYEQKILENKETGLNFDYSKVDFSQTYFSIGVSEQCQIKQC